jgi:hypothetical protein
MNASDWERYKVQDAFDIMAIPMSNSDFGFIRGIQTSKSRRLQSGAPRATRR